MKKRLAITVTFLCLVIVILCSIISSCDNSTISEAEAIANVIEYEFGEGDHMPWYSRIGAEATNAWNATYEGKGHWIVYTSLENKEYSYDYFENSGKVAFRGVETK